MKGIAAGEKKKALGHILAVLTVCVWGSTFISSKVLLEAFSPVQIMILRFVIAYVVLWALHPKWEKIQWKQEVGLLLMSLFGCSWYFLAENSALQYTQTTNVSIIVSSAPIWTAVLAHFFTKNEKLHRNIWYGFLLAFAGVILVVMNGAFILKLNPVGDLLSAVAAFFWAIYSVMLKRYSNVYSSITLNRKLMFYGLLTALPFLLAEGTPVAWSALADWKMIFNILFLGVLGSGICYVTWTVASKKLGIVTTNNYIYFNPFITLVVAGIFLREQVTLVGLLGSVLIIGGVVLSGRKPAKFFQEESC